MKRTLITVLLLLWPLAARAASGVQYLRAAELRGAVETYVASLPAREGSEFAVECRDIPDSIALPGGALRIAVDPSATPVIRGRVAFAVEVAVDGITVRRVVVPALVRTYASVLIASRTLDARASVAEGDVRSARLETTEWARRAVADAGALAGRRTKRIIAEGSVLFEELLEQVPLIARGDHVTLRAAAKGVCISTGAVAMEDGRLGSVITVKAAHTRDRLKVRVIEAGVVASLEE